MARDGDLRPLLREHLRDGDWNSIETGFTAGGVPDSNYCFPGGKEGWVEGKLTHGWKVKVRPAQVGWMDRRSRKGGRCFFAIRRVVAAKNVDELYIVPGSASLDFARAGFSLRDIKEYWVFCGGPSGWDWDHIRRIFTQ